MKKAILISSLILMMLTACTNQTGNDSIKDNSTLPDHITVVQEDKWPENDYTSGLPVPGGKIEWVMVDAKSNMCSISVTELDEAQYQTFMQGIADLGFSVQHSVSEDVKGEGYTSFNTLLSNGEKNLSIAYGNRNLTLAISFNGN